MRYWKQGQRKGPLVGRSPLEGLRGHSWEMALFHFLNFLLPLSTQVMQKSVKGDHLCGSLQFGLDHRVHEHPQPSPDTTMHTHSLPMHSTGRRCKEPRSPKEGNVPDPVRIGSSACTRVHSSPSQPFPDPLLSPGLPPPSRAPKVCSHPSYCWSQLWFLLLSLLSHTPFPPRPAILSRPNAPAPACPVLVRLPCAPLSALRRPALDPREADPTVLTPSS